MERQNVMREVGRLVTGGYYDHQQIRISERNRIRDIIRKVNEGIDISKPEEKKDEKTYSKEYKDERLPFLLAKMVEEEKLTVEESEYISKTLDILKAAEREEAMHKALMEKYIESEPIWYRWLKDVKGIGPVIAANLIKNFGYCETFKHVSSVWKYCGLHVVDGAAPKRKKGEKLDFKLSLRSFAWNVGDSFVKQRTVPYRNIYDKEKARQAHLVESDADNAPKNKKHADLRARRKMIKVFLQHYWKVSRDMKGLPTARPYALAKMDHVTYIEPVGVME